MVSRKKILLFFLLSFLTNQTFAQSISFEKYYDYGFAEAGNCVQQTFDGGYIVAGRQGITIGVSRVVLQKTDAYGVVQWNKIYGYPNGNYAYSVQQTADSGYIVAGYTTQFTTSNYDAYLIKTDKNGDTLWTKTYGGAGYQGLFSVAITNDGGYILAGQYDYNGYLIKTNSLGDTLWTKQFPSINGVEFYSVKQTSDSGFVLGGINIPGPSPDFYLVKTNVNGDTLWTKTWGWGGGSADFIKSVEQTSDGGYIVGGYTFNSGNNTVYLAKTNSLGDTIWTKEYSRSADDGGYCVQQTVDGGYIIVGITLNQTPLNYDPWLIKTDSNGDTLWAKTFGGIDDDFGYFVQQTSDGGYIITGIKSPTADLYLIKTDSAGNVPTGINDLSGTNQIFVNVYPNPVSSVISIHLLSAVFSQSISINLYNETGQLVKEIVMHGDELKINVEELSSGFYFIQLVSENNILASKKIIVQH